MEDSKTEKAMQQLGKEYFEALVQGFNSKDMGIEELLETFEGFFIAAEQGHGWTSKEFEYFWKEVEAQNTRYSRTTKQNVLNSIISEYQGHLDELNKDQRDNLQRILKLYEKNPDVHPDVGWMLERLENNLKEPIGYAPITVNPGD